MNNFFKEKGTAILALSVIFTFATLFWTSDIVSNQGDLSSIDLGWPVDFVSQNHSQKDPPRDWFPNNVGFGLPQEYSTSVYFLPLAFNIASNFFVILIILFTIFKYNPNLPILWKIINVKYVIVAVGLAFLVLVSFFVLDNSKNVLQIGVGISPPPTEDLPLQGMSVQQLMQEYLVNLLETTDESLVVEGIDGALLRWEDEDGYVLLVPATISIQVARLGVTVVDSDDIPNTYFSKEMVEIDTALTDQGFIMDARNTSSLSLDKGWYDHVWTYRHHTDLCQVVVNSDYGTHKNSRSQMGYILTISCSDVRNLELAQAEQRPLLDALKLRGTGAALRITGQIEDYIAVSVGYQRGGTAALLQKEVSGYRVIFSHYQESPYCEDLDNAKLPPEVIKELVIGGGGCFETDGSPYRKPNF